jgi:ketosteroid isomerase-like protein
MSEENVEIVRRFIAAMQRSFAAYWRDPRPLSAALETGTESAEYREALTYLDPDFEWKTVFLGETHSGYLETAKVWDDYLRWAEDYRLSLEETADLSDDQVYAVVNLVGKAKAGGGPMDARFFDVITVRNGVIVKIEEYLDRDAALEAAGLRD